MELANHQLHIQLGELSMNKYIHLLSGSIVTAQRFDASKVITTPETVKIGTFYFVRTPKGNEPISPGDWIVRFDDYRVITDDELFSKMFRPVQDGLSDSINQLHKNMLDSDELQTLMRSESESFPKATNEVRIDQLNSRICHLANKLSQDKTNLNIIEELVDRISEYTNLIQ